MTTLPNTPGSTHLRLVDENGEVHESCPHCALKNEEIAGLERNIRSLVIKLGRAERQLEQARGDEPEAKAIKGVLAYWQQTCGHEGCKIPAGGVRWEKTRARMKEGFTVSDLKRAIDGAARYPYCSKDSTLPGMRSSTGTTRYDDIPTIFKSEQTVERLKALADTDESDPKPASDQSGLHTSERTRQAIERVGSLYNADDSERLGFHIADCPLCGQGMRIDHGIFRCYGECESAEIEAKLDGKHLPPPSLARYL